MKSVERDKNLIAYCGLYCGACKAYLKEKCNGCAKHTKAAWCKVRSCCIGNSYSSCAECKEFDNVNQCRKFNNFISKIFGFVFNSDRKACIDRIKEIGNEEFACEMTKNCCVSFKKRK